MKKEWKINIKRLLFVLAAVVLVGRTIKLATVSLHAQVCPNHLEHTAECGYQEAKEGHPCEHQHTDECYREEKECVHEHDSGCYDESLVCDNDDEEHVHDDGCYERELNCSHTCSKESGCIKEVLDCHHTHDESCGYVEPEDAKPCTHSCELCSGSASGEGENTAADPEQSQGGSGSSDTTTTDQTQGGSGSSDTTTTDQTQDGSGSSDATTTDQMQDGSGSSDTTTTDQTQDGSGSSDTATTDQTQDGSGSSDTATTDQTQDGSDSNDTATTDQTQGALDNGAAGTDVQETPKEDAALEEKQENKCTCTALCTSDAVNKECPVCGAEGAVIADCCKGGQETTGEKKTEEKETGETVNNPCICTEACTADHVNEECLICSVNGVALEKCCKGIIGAAEPVEEEQKKLTEEQQAVQDRIDALPTVEEYDALTKEEQDELYLTFADIFDACAELSYAECEQLDLTKLGKLFQSRINSLPTVEEYQKLTKEEQEAVYETVARLADEYVYFPEDMLDLAKLEKLFEVFNADISLMIVVPEVHDHDDKSFTAWESGEKLPNEAGSYYLTKDVVLSSVWTVSENISLCLNGHSITGTASEELILVEGTLTVYDCTGDDGSIEGGTASNGAVKVISSGTFVLHGGTIKNSIRGIYNEGIVNLYGGVIRDNNNGGRGGGIYNRGTINIYGGVIRNNKSGYGGGIYNSRGTLNLHGGSIINNETTSEDGGGVYNNNVLNLYDGKVIITGNTGRNGNASDLKVSQSYLINVKATSSLQGTRIGILYSSSSGETGTVTSGYERDRLGDPEKYFFADQSRLYVRYSPTSGEVEIARDISSPSSHTHNWSFTASTSGGKGFDLSAVCTAEGTCAYKAEVSALHKTIAVADEEYTGKPYAGLKITDELSGAISDLPSCEIRYTGTTAKGDTYSSTEPPTDAGTYQAVIKYGGTDYPLNFEITKRPLTVMAKSYQVKYGKLVARSNIDEADEKVAIYGLLSGHHMADISIKGKTDSETGNSSASEADRIITPSGGYIYAGEDAAASPRVTENYEISYQSSTYQPVAMDFSLEAKFSTDRWIYGETMPELKLTDGNDREWREEDLLGLTKTYYKYSGSRVETTPDNSGAASEGGEPRWVGAYILKIEIQESSVMKAGSCEAVFYIEPRAISITPKPLASEPKIGETVSLDVSQMTIGGKGLVSGDQLSSITVSVDTSSASSNVEIKPSGAVIKKGEKDVTEFYNIAYGNGRTAVVKKELTGQSVKLSGWTYGDTENTPEVRSVSGAAASYQYYRKVSAGNYVLTDADNSGASQTGGKPEYAGDYKLVAEIAETETYKGGTCETVFTIAKRNVTIAALQQTVKAGAALQSRLTDVSKVSVSQLAARRDGSTDQLSEIKLSGDTASATENGTITVSAAKIVNGTADMTENYNISYQSGKLVVQLNPLPLKLTMEDWTYGDSAAEPVVSGVPGGETAAITYYTDAACTRQTGTADGASGAGKKPSNAGSYSVKVVVNGTASHEKGEVVAAFTISQRKASVKANNQWLVVNEEIEQNKASATGLLNTHSLFSVVLKGSSTEAATNSGRIEASNAVIHDSADQDVTKNYMISYEPGILYVSRVKLNASVTLANWTYGETAAEPVFKEEESIKDNCKPSYSYYKDGGTEKTTNDNSGAESEGGVPKYAGNWALIASVPQTDKHISGYTGTEFRIRQKEITITAKDQSNIPAGGQITKGTEQVILSAVLPYGDTLKTITLTDSGTAAETTSGTITPSKAVIVDKAGKDVTANYSITYQKGKLTVKANAIEPKVTLNGWVYGNTPNSPSVSGNTGNGKVTYTYYTDADCKIETTAGNSGAASSGGVPVNAGTYYVKAVIEKTAAHEGASCKTSFTIAKAQMTVSAKDVSVTEDGKEHGISVSVSKPSSGAEIRYGTEKGTYNKSSSPTWKNAGEYKVYYQVTADNYETYTGSAKIKIKEKQKQSETSNTANTANTSSGGKTSGGGTTQTAKPASEPETKPEEPPVPVSEPITEPEPENTSGTSEKSEPVIEPVAEPEPEPEPESEPEPEAEPEKFPSVKITVNVPDETADGGRLESSIKTDVDDILKAVLTYDELKAVQDGEDAEVRLTVTRLTRDVPKEAKAEIERMTGILSEWYDGLKIGGYLDLVIEKKIGTGEWKSVSRLNQELEITIGIPEKLQKNQAEYWIMRYHDGNCDLLDDIDEDDKTITIHSGLFSTYAILYNEQEAEAEINWMIITICLASGFAVIWLVIILLRKEEKNDRKMR